MGKESNEKGSAPSKTVVPENKCTTIIPSPDGKAPDEFCQGKLVIEEVPRPGRSCLICHAFYPA